MKGVSVFLFLGVLAEWSSAQFLNNRPYPTYSLEQMPDTDFSCRDKILGGYYADAETQCQMFHVCVKVAGVGVQDFRFLCPNGTAFDQDHQICADWEDVDCDATTLYYSSDNFDLYRIGSGYESKAVKYGEEEEPFSLQRAETGDIRLNREHQTQRINQQKEAFNYRPKSSHQPRNNNNNNYNTNNNNNNNNNEKDIFKGSSSSNFFNNKNGGKETDDDEDDSANVNANQNEDRFQRRKVTRKQNRRPSYDNQTTEKPERTNGFTNNFAGSSYIPTTARPASTTHNNQRQRQRNRVNPQYNNADNFRQNPRNNEDDGQYKEQPQYSVSTPAPFRQTQQYNNNGNKQHNSNNGAYNPTTASPQPTTRSTENYPSSFPQQPTKFNNNQYSQTKEPENYPSTPFKKNENYPLTSQKQTKETENYPTTSSFNNNNNNNNNNNRNTQQQIYNSNYEVTKTKQTENYPSPIAKKPTTPFKQTDNYPTTFAPKTSPFKNSNFGSSQFTTAAPRANPAFTTGNQQSTTNNNKQNSQSTNFNQQYDNTRFTNTQSTFNQPQTNKQTTQYNPSTQQKQTTQFTQYTPTVPRITTPYASSTTQASQPRRSNRYDETQYDDGSYNSRYENDDNQKGRDEEFLKTAHSTNIASSRNEYIQNTKNAGVSTTQKPRPFSVTPNASKATNTYNSGNTNIASKAPSNVSKPPPAAGKESQPKKQKDASYDYAYYDSNAGAEHEYDIGADIEKSEKLKIKKA